MPELNPEQLSRQQIDEQLRACGWIVQDYKAIDFSAGRGRTLTAPSLCPIRFALC
jgi:hypothetical protein